MNLCVHCGGCVHGEPCDNRFMQRSLRISLLFAAFSAAALLLSTPHAASAAQIAVKMIDNQFSQKNITISAGDTVTWINQGAMAHTATADNGTFDSGTVQPGQSFAAIFNTPGTYAYYCKFHGAPGGAGMAGIITVVAANTSSGAVTSTNTNASTNIAPASSVTAAQLQAQVQALLNQIAILQQQRNSVPAPSAPASASTDSSSCPLIGRSLKRGSSGDDVLRLQQFLARDASVYPEGLATGFYGALTEAAVKRWQVKYNIVSSGTPETTGYGVVGPRTAAAISILCTTGSYGGVSGPTGSSSSSVGGYITVTPISGASPLTVNITATVNTTGSCSGATYTLDFGDGSAPQQILAASGNCSQQSQTFMHVYAFGGTFQVKLSAGAHQTTATVVVAGTPATPTAIVCPPAYQPTVVNGTTVCTPVSNQAAPPYSYSSPVLSSAPSDSLTFTLQFDLPSSCTGYDVDWGDGTVHNIQSNSSSCAQSQSVQSINHTYASASSYTITLKRGPTLGRQDDIAVTIAQ